MSNKMSSTFDSLRRIETLDELGALQPNSEIILVRHAFHPNDSFTVHGKFQRFAGGRSNYVDISDYLHLPLELSFDPESPREFLAFLRSFSSPHYLRNKKPMGYNHFGAPHNFTRSPREFESYLVKP